jgi:predicted double-glycine peptidase
MRKIGNVPFYPQEEYQCGPASLAGVLNYWGVRGTPEQVAKEVFSSSVKGTLTLDMVLYAQKKGMDATLYAGTMEDLKKNIDSGFPVIVLVDYGVSLYQANHFMVVIGYSENGILANSGRVQNKFIPEKDFLRTWEKTRCLTLLIKKQTTDSRQ